MNPQTAILIAKLLNLAVLAATRGPQMIAGLEALRAKVDQMIAEGRDPTTVEISALDAEIDGLRDRLHAIET